MNRLQLRPYTAEARAFGDGAASPRSFLEACIASIEAHEAQVQAFVHYDLAAARKAADASAERWRTGRTLSAYDGMPVGVKDVIETEDFPTEMGSPLFAGWRSGRDAAVVKALRAAGAVILGKTVTTEFAGFFPNKTHNPHDLTRTPGGSSSGSAAGVAAGFISLGIGTQVIGSILRPASFCGVYGFKPSVGGINRGGSHDFLSQSCTGVLAASLEDGWIVARDLADRAGGDPGFPGLAGPPELPAATRPRRLALIETVGWREASEEARQALLAARERLAAAGVEIVTRTSDRRIELVETALERSLPLSRFINAYESRWPYNVYRDMDATKLSADAAGRLVEAFAITGDEYRAALAERSRIRALYNGLGELVDGCIALSAIGPAPSGLESTGNPACVVPGSMLGVPAINLPALTCEGLPLGLQVLGFEQKDAALFGVARFVEASL